jgi:argonaute-like protein implicated in RNA metabolism and viral defense
MTDADIPVDRLAKIYRKMRAAEQELTREYESKIEAIKQQREQVGLALKDRILALGDGVTSLKTDQGTIILSKKTRYYPQDRDALKKFIIENEAVDLLEFRVAQKNMATFIAENPENQPPGLNVITEFDVTVRAPSAG